MEVYDRSRDIFPYECVDKSEYFDIAPQAIVIVYNFHTDRWVYELFDNNDWDLLSFYDRGRLYGTCLTVKYSPDDVVEILAQKYPDAIFKMAPDYDEWYLGYCKIF